MIPSFPEFKRIDIDDRVAIESHTRKYPPYSDFNFTSLYCWNIQNRTQFSSLNNNLVIRFTDYLTGDPFYTFLGESEVDKTANILLDRSVQEGLTAHLKLIPEITANRLSRNFFDVKDDQDNRDYIILSENLKSYNGPLFAKKRRETRSFTHTIQVFRISLLDLNNEETMQMIKNLFAMWSVGKNANLILEEQHEYKALCRYIGSGMRECLISIGVFVDQKLEAFWLVEDLGDGYSISHFEKANTLQYKGIFPYLKQQVGGYLLERGILHINLEQDLGISGLRINKESYGPHQYLKKYIVKRHI